MVYKNLPGKYYRKAMIFRLFFDYLAALQFLLKGYPANARSILKARQDFNRQKKNYRMIRKENLEKTVDELPSGIFPHSVLLKYYIINQKKYTQIFPDAE